MSRKKVSVYSFGQIWPEAYPTAPGKDVLQVIIDVRAAITDPLDEVGAVDGTDAKVQDFIMKGDAVQFWVDFWLHYAESYIEQMRDDAGFKELRIYFMCAGGFQRSVCVAIKAFERFSKTYEGLIDISVEHLTMEKTRKLAEAKAKA